MDIEQAAPILAALGHAGRLNIVTTVRKEHDGMSAGEIVAAVGGIQNTVSGQLKILSQVGILKQERRATQIIYTVERDILRDLAALVGS